MLATLTKMVPLSALRPGKNPRGKTGSVQDLLTSFDHAPQLHPITVRRLPGARDEYEIIAGHRRAEAARKKGWSHIEAKVVDLDDTTSEMLALEENLRRKALPDEATAVARLLELYKLTTRDRRGGDRRSKAFAEGRIKTASDRRSSPEPDEGAGAAEKLARALGRSVRTVRQQARIGSRGTSRLKDALAAKLLTVGQAERIAGLDPAGQDRRVDEIERERQGYEVLPADLRRAAQALAFVEKTFRSRRPGSLSPKVVEQLRERVEAVQEAFGGLTRGRKTSARATARSGRGTPDPEARADASRAVSLDLKSANRKLSPVGTEPAEQRPRLSPMKPYMATTAVSIEATCPSSCPFKSAPGVPQGCYSDAGFSRIKMQRLDEGARGLTPDEVTAEEARQIDDAFGGGPIPQDGARGGRDLRLHVGGEVSSTAGAKLLAKAAAWWRARGGGAVFSYTHRWKEIPRSAWGEAISVLASVERPEDIEAARKRGYAAAIVVEDFPSDEAFSLPGTNAKVIPCPAETRGTNCAECRLCLDRDLLEMNAAIAFKVHGRQAEQAREALVQINLGRVKGAMAKVDRKSVDPTPGHRACAAPGKVRDVR
jgi:ParB-like chromosome segregation protein Spo0J